MFQHTSNKEIPVNTCMAMQHCDGQLDITVVSMLSLHPMNRRPMDDSHCSQSGRAPSPGFGSTSLMMLSVNTLCSAVPTLNVMSATRMDERMFEHTFGHDHDFEAMQLAIN